MSLRTLIQLRNLSTSRGLWRPQLSIEYKSKKLWDERFTCPLLSDEDIVKKINNKIIMGDQLNNLETDIFINISSPSNEETVQLEESAILLKKLRKSLAAHTLLPSTPHGICRLFLESNRLSSLIALLNDRITYGIFPDFYALNLLLDEALEKNDYASASKLASLVMLQEEFGMNHITDSLAFYSVAKYIEAKHNFDDWPPCDVSSDPILKERQNILEESAPNQEEAKNKKEKDNDDEEEDDAEYIRIPFLRNPYFDNHFDLKDPRKICGKTLCMLSESYASQDNQVASKSKLLGSILEGSWSSAINALEDCKKSNISLGPVAEVSKFYIENLHTIEEPKVEEKEALLSGIDSMSGEGKSLSDLLESNSSSFEKTEKDDIQQLKDSFSEFSRLRMDTKKRLENKLKRNELIAEIKRKKEELKHREQYLYFYDNLKKKKVARIEYR